MQAHERKDFGQLVKDVMAYYGKDTSKFLLDVWWDACQSFDYEQIVTAVNRHIKDAEHGQFPPKVADMVRILAGTATDRAVIAWGKTLAAMTSVGGHQDVVFDDPAIHAVVEDLGGWPKVCRTETKDLGYLQHRFCESHRAYTRAPGFDYPRRLSGESTDTDGEYLRVGLTPPRPVLVGNADVAQQVYLNGSNTGKTAITFPVRKALEVSKLMRLTNQNDNKGSQG
ncbi:DUF6475 domain-containing protein [Variovorax sp. PAMC26660]|uniref:DUF6475 domain-containing protein n=1 Tax=Variovorax sp. PAMC26660 TaxID=2762322 RepID=UPI00164DEFFD|nr:DUF6475 domain-containing protein [Variovorax sp. PAMC26660]QNK68449.1 hypothetical protein H7F35_01490 [Variovorax sp. PAMC26660]